MIREKERKKMRKGEGARSKGRKEKQRQEKERREEDGEEGVEGEHTFAKSGFR